MLVHALDGSEPWLTSLQQVALGFRLTTLRGAHHLTWRPFGTNDLVEHVKKHAQIDQVLAHSDPNSATIDQTSQSKSNRAPVSQRPTQQHHQRNRPPLQTQEYP